MKGASHMNETRHVVVMVQDQVDFDAAFHLFELRPWKQRKAQRNGGRVQRQQLVFETKRFCARTKHRLVTKSIECFPEQLFEQTGWPMLIGVAQAGFIRCLRYSQVRQLRSEEHTSELQSLRHLVCRPLHEKKK